MGVYLSQPITDKDSSDCENAWLKCGVSSMQGWRATQEDAHNCCLDFDNDSSFFAVYDGHGGHEVAEYTAKHLPEFLKTVEAYKSGDFEKALIDAFIDFDSTLTKEAVIEELKNIAKSRQDSEDIDKEEDDVDDVQELKEEARMPLNELIAKYTSGAVKPSIKSGAGSSVFASPYLKAKTSTSGVNEQAGSSKSKDESVEGEPALVNGTTETNGEVESETPVKSSDEGSSSKEESSSGSASVNGEHKEEEKAENEDEHQKKNEEESEKKVEKISDKKGEEGGEDNINMKKIIKSAIRIAKKKATVTMLAQLFEDASDSDSENDESFHENDTGVADDDEDEDEEEDEEMEDEGEEDEEGEEEGDDDENEVEDSEEDGHGLYRVGMDSGCTAVAAFLHKRRLYVANAGDSRAVLCHKSEAIDLSVDHKPDDDAESERIKAAGGAIWDGRVNGGLNLSRALGDHSYKKSDMDARSQMITALPDIQVRDIDPVEDEFLVLACDGIWNSMSSQEVVDFVKPLIASGEKLSKICEKLFEKCLASDTFGDGTGCDNMTCIIIQFNENETSRTSNSGDTAKRSASPILSDDSAKRPKD